MNFINDSPLPFVCLVRQDEAEDWFPKKKIGEATYLIIDKIDKSDVEYKEELHYHQLHLAPFHSLRLALRGEEYQDQYSSSACGSFETGKTYYSCNECNNYYHKECVESPPTFVPSYHPKYPLQLLTHYEGMCPECFYSGLKLHGLVYYSNVYDLFMDPLCARKQNFTPINDPDRHEHALHLFPRKASLICDVCASGDTKNCLYSCLQCDFVVHKRCIDLPYVIQISCHGHRLSFTNPLRSGNDYCGVCRRKINENYGSYSCTRCSYAVHTECATSLDIWAGLELKDQRELEDDNIELSFEEMGDGIIRHFSHAHHRMRLVDDTEIVFDAKQHYCQACTRPFYDGNIYKCMETECDFALHEACANLPRIKHVVVHEHRFVLKSVIDEYFICRFCLQFSCGFGYTCEEGCWDYHLDVRCASISELVDHPSHPHPFFLFYQRHSFQDCSACERGDRYTLNCIDRDFVLCFYCATLPYKFKCEHDEHMLTLSYEKIASGPPCWCQICEETTDLKKGYYTCNECGVTFHIECILGNHIYMKEGHISCKIEIIPNNRLSRPICNGCHKRCQYNIAFKNERGNIFCSYKEAIFSG